MKTVQTLQTDLTSKLAALVWLLRKVGPYLAIEILMPGGTLIAIALFLYRRRNAAPDGNLLAFRAYATRALEQVRDRLQPMRERLLPMRERFARLPSALRASGNSPSGRPFVLMPMRALARVRASV